MIEQYNDSIVAKGNNITQRGLSTISGNSNEANISKHPSIPAPLPNPNSPSKKIQKRQLIVAIISVSIGLVSLILVILSKCSKL